MPQLARSIAVWMGGSPHAVDLRGDRPPQGPATGLSAGYASCSASPRATVLRSGTTAGAAFCSGSIGQLATVIVTRTGSSSGAAITSATFIPVALPAGDLWMVDQAGNYLTDKTGAYLSTGAAASEVEPVEAAYLTDLTGAYLVDKDGNYLNVEQGEAASPNSDLLGTNLELLIDYSSNNWATIDVFKTSRPWAHGNQVTGEWDDGRPLAVDADGWPTSFLPQQCARTILLLNAGFPAGKYVFKWDGVGTLDIGHNGTTVSTAPNRVVIDIPSTSYGVFVNIWSTTPGNHVRNITCKHIDHEFNTAIWHPDFIESIRYYGTLRFMDMQATNNNEVGTWSARAKLTSCRWGDKAGIPVEAMVDLCNQIDAHPWFCMPHLSDDFYVEQFATIVKNTLKPSLKPFVEFSNEIWNFQFSQTQYALAQGDANTARFGAGSAPTWITWGSMRARQVHSVWQDVYGGLGAFRRVYGAWTTYYYMTDQGLKFEGNSAHFDVLAIAPYFGGNLAQIVDGGPGTVTSTYTETQMLDAVEAILESSSFTHMDQNKVVADSFGLELACYEAGQHLVRVGSGGETVDNNLDDLLIDVQDHPRMGGFYTMLLEAWKTRSGGNLPLCHFLHAGNWSLYGSWGARQRLSDPIDMTQPKALSLKSFAQANPRSGSTVVTPPTTIMVIGGSTAGKAVADGTLGASGTMKTRLVTRSVAGIVVAGREPDLALETTNLTGTTRTISLSYTVTNTTTGISNSFSTSASAPAGGVARFPISLSSLGYAHRWVDFSTSWTGGSEATQRAGFLYLPKVAGQQTDATGFELGMNFGFVSDSRDYQAAQMFGVTHVRTNYEWSGVEYPDNVMHWEVPDALIEMAERYGMAVMWMMAYGTDYASAQPNPFRSPPNLTMWADFCTRMATRYGTRIRWYEMWNESDNSNFWTGNAAQYIATLQAGYNAIKAVNTGLKVLTAGFAGAGLPDFLRVADVEKNTLETASAYFDIHASHPHGDLSVQEATLTRIAAWRAAQTTQRPLFANEIGRNTAGGLFTLQAVEAVKKLVAGRAVGMIGHTIYEMRDGGPDVEVDEQSYGIFTADRQPKPVVGAISELVSRIRHKSYVGTISGLTTGSRRLELSGS